MKPRDDWEARLRQGLDAATDLGDEEPPNQAALQMLVVQVQREQRSRMLRDLALFWGCGAAIIAAGFYAFERQPWAYLVFQAALAIGLIVAVGVGSARGKRVTE